MVVLLPTKSVSAATTATTMTNGTSQRRLCAQASFQAFFQAFLMKPGLFFLLCRFKCCFSSSAVSVQMNSNIY